VRAAAGGREAVVADRGARARGGTDDGAEFLSRLFETQHFERFKVSQDAPDLALFHALYQARRVRE
jgi:hypothetical protein